MTEQMAQPKRNRPSEVWENWLRGFALRANPNTEYYRYQVLAFLNRNSGTSNTLWPHLGKVLAKGFPGRGVTIFNRVAGQLPTIAYSNMSKKNTHLVFTHRAISRLSKEANTWMENKSLLGAQLIINEKEYQKVNFIPLLDKVLLIVSEENITKNDHQFLFLIQQLLKQRGVRQELTALLSAETERLSTLIHHLSEGLIILNKKLEVELWNRPLQRLTNFSPIEAENRYYSQVLDSFQQPEWLEDLLIEYGPHPMRNVFFRELGIRTKQKLQKWVAVSGSFLRDKEGNIVQTIIIVRDISRHKELEDRKNEFISIATHELRTPLTAIKGYLALLRRDTSQFNKKQEGYLAHVNEASERLATLAEDLLQVNQLEENRVKFSLRPVNVLPILRKVVSDFTQKAIKKNITLTLETPNFATVVPADPTRIEQVFANLVDNAIKYTLKGRVTIRFTQEKDRLSGEQKIGIRITDTGIGLDQKEIKNIFEKFHRAQHPITGSESGAGLGLFIVKSFIERQGGVIKVTSRLNQGTQFLVLFPTVEAKALGRKIDRSKQP